MLTRMQKFLRPQRRKMYFWVGSFSCVVGFLFFIIIIFRIVANGQKFVPNFIAGYCAIFATIMSLFHILEHLSCFADAECQTKIVRILFMVPLYAMVSWISLMCPSGAEYLNLIRDAYESYVIYSFFQLMIALMGGIDTLYRALMVEEHPPVHHIFPLCYLEPMKVTPTFIQNCRLCLFQFMITKPVVTIIVIILTATGHMGTGLADLAGGYFWTTLVYNISITIAFTALLYFYIGLKDFMEGKNALMKFLCIKAVIFLSFWQGLLIQILAVTNLLPSFSYWTPEETPEAIQSLLICVEMMFISFAHRYCFGSDEYQQTGGNDAILFDDDHANTDAPYDHLPPSRYSILDNLVYTLKHEDILSDVQDIVQNR